MALQIQQDLSAGEPSLRGIERLIYWGARHLYNTSVAHSPEMKKSLTSTSEYEQFRAKEIARISEVVRSLGLDVRGKQLLDVGCNDGAVSAEYLRLGAAHVTGVDIDEAALARARARHTEPRLTFLQSSRDGFPLPNGAVDLIFSYDVLEHVSKPIQMVREMFRVLRPGGVCVIGTQGWGHPFAPHLWSTMPVPWAHLLLTDERLFRVCRAVYNSSWYRPNMHDFDHQGRRIQDKYTEREISPEYLNKARIKDFERFFRQSGFVHETRTVPFKGMVGRLTSPLLKTRLREYLSGYVWFVLRKPS